jgi:hypothetical protein
MTEHMAIVTRNAANLTEVGLGSVCNDIGASLRIPDIVTLPHATYLTVDLPTHDSKSMLPQEIFIQRLSEEVCWLVSRWYRVN